MHPTVVCNKFFLFHFHISLQNISVGREVKLNFKYLILADGRIFEYPDSGSGEKMRFINIGDNFLPTTAHTTTTPGNVDVNILPNIILVIVNVDVNILPITKVQPPAPGRQYHSPG